MDMTARIRMPVLPKYKTITSTRGSLNRLEQYLSELTMVYRSISVSSVQFSLSDIE